MITNDGGAHERLDSVDAARDRVAFDVVTSGTTLELPDLSWTDDDSLSSWEQMHMWMRMYPTFTPHPEDGKR